MVQIVAAAAGAVGKKNDERNAQINGAIDAKEAAKRESEKSMFAQMMDAILAGKERREERILQAGQPNMGAFKQLYGSGM